MRSPFRWPGGKSKKTVQQQILAFMPEDTEHYLEPMVGGGGIFFGLDPAKIKSRWINDVNSHLISVYRAFDEKPEEFINLCRAIEPARPGELEVATKGVDGKKYNARLGKIFSEFSYNETMSQALRFFFINRTVWAGRVNYDPAFKSRMYYSNPTGWNIVERPDFLESVAQHIKNTQITSIDYENLLLTPKEKCWVYLDPPYVVDTKLNNGSKLYQFGFSWEDHSRFVEICRKTKHKIAISYDDVPQVRDWFKGFEITPLTWKHCGTTNKVKKDGRELVITNYSLPKAVRAVKEKLLPYEPIFD